MMAVALDREKVIKGLEKCRRCECDDCTEKGASKAPFDCPAYDDFVDSAIVLLKEQEPMRVLYQRDCETRPNHYERKGFCPKCHQALELNLNRSYCGFCGQEVKWDA